MRYLDFELYNKISLENNRRDRDEWNLLYELWQKEFSEVVAKFPEPFIKEFRKNYFYGYIIRDIGIKSNVEDRDYCVNMTLCDKNGCHRLEFYGVTFAKLEMEVLKANGTECIVCEIGEEDEEVNFIAMLLTGGELEFCFTKMEYTKIK